VRRHKSDRSALLPATALLSTHPSSPRNHPPTPHPPQGPPISPERLYDAVTVILSYQNRDGGMATYENTRSFHALEIINPAGERL
jgi:hypothetical protein